MASVLIHFKVYDVRTRLIRIDAQAANDLVEKLTAVVANSLEIWLLKESIKSWNSLTLKLLSQLHSFQTHWWLAFSLVYWDLIVSYYNLQVKFWLGVLNFSFYSVCSSITRTKFN